MDTFTYTGNNNENYNLYYNGLFLAELVTDEDTMMYIVAQMNENEAKLKADWQEATARNNETRSFEAWLTDKAENLIS